MLNFCGVRFCGRNAVIKMASFSSQAFSRGKELVREGDGEEDDGEELLDPRVKVSNQQ